MRSEIKSRFKPPAFVLYDGRAARGNKERASVMDTAYSEKEAVRQGTTTWRGHHAVWFESKIVAMRGPGHYVCEEVMRTDLPPFSRFNREDRPKRRVDNNPVW